jgi:predicted DNA-binding protein (MmcQ/YjbR family)
MTVHRQIECGTLPFESTGSTNPRCTSNRTAGVDRFGCLLCPACSTLVYDCLMDDKKILEKLREICLALPKTSQTTTFGHPTFQVGTKTFTVLETYKGVLSICVKVGKKMQPVFLEDARFYRTPYVGQHGWVSLRANTKLNWTEIRDLVEGSYQLVHVKKRRR